MEKTKMVREKPCGGAISVKAKHLLGLSFTAIVEDEINRLSLTHGLSDPLEISLDFPWLTWWKESALTSFWWSRL
ncbi:hypothetical protein [Calderihabitans maritimus]|uniref:hypothetical protein n=1 Tax=Calderihabitans maritimus TaxID=1246530 RepID=UPI001EDF2325|nr:hypothetical protein [Calderihabitans maritimus]